MLYGVTRAFGRTLVVLLLTLSGLLFAQQNGRFAALKEQAFTAFDRGQFDQVAGKLEEIWEQDQSDPKVDEYLGMGYLYGERSLTKAKPVMLAAIAHGGQASFLVQHSHERFGLLNGDTMNNYCGGRLSISPGKVAFTADGGGEHSALFTTADLDDIRVLGGSPGRVQVKSAKKTYLFRVKSLTQAEAVFLVELVTSNLKK